LSTIARAGFGPKRAAVPAHLFAWLLLAVANAIEISLTPIPANGLSTRLALHAVDAGQLLALGLLVELAVRISRRLGKRARWGWLLLAVLSMSLAALTLPEDLGSVIESVV
jgi:hypothetical protein